MAVKEKNMELMKIRDAWIWAYFSRIMLQSGQFLLKGHEYLIDPLRNMARRTVLKKGAQMGFTEIAVLKTLHGMIYGYYPKGVLYLFPTIQDITDFSKARFNPLIISNQEIGRFVKDTDSVQIKKVRSSILYLRSARPTQKIEGIKKTSHHLKTIPVDRIVFDERDEMDDEMIDLALERISKSDIKEEVYLSTPSIPDFGIDREYQDSDQRIWMIRCQKCGGETCLEMEFPECLGTRNDGSAFRKCSKCGAEIYPKDGRWDARYPQNDTAGFWISQLNSLTVDPTKILEMFLNPPHGNLAEVYNSKLGMAYIAAENRLTRQDVYACCGHDAMVLRDRGPCAMGVDVGRVLHVVIGKKLGDKIHKIIYVGQVPEFEDLHDMAQRFNVRSAVIDYPYDKRKVREFIAAEPYKVFGSQYQDQMKNDVERRDEEAHVITIDRTYICDVTHDLVWKGMIELPRRCPEIEEYAKEMANIAKILEENKDTGAKVYRYRKLDADHYRHATNYYYMASQEKIFDALARREVKDVPKQAPAWSPFANA